MIEVDANPEATDHDVPSTSHGGQEPVEESNHDVPGTSRIDQNNGGNITTQEIESIL